MKFEKWLFLFVSFCCFVGFVSLFVCLFAGQLAFFFLFFFFFFSTVSDFKLGPVCLEL